MRFKASVANISWPGPKQNILERLRGEAKLNRGALVEFKPIESIRLDLSAIFFFYFGILYLYLSGKPWITTVSRVVVAALRPSDAVLVWSGEVRPYE